MNIKDYMISLGQQAKAAGREISRADSGIKNAALLAIAEQLASQPNYLAAENAKDLQAGKEKGLDAALLDRLELTPARIEAMIEGLTQVAALADPVGAISNLDYRPSGIQVGQMRVPLGVIGIIYESRPNVTVDAAALCLKSGNACILRGGSESINSNKAIAQCIAQGLAAVGLPVAAVQVVETTDRAAVGELITLSDYVDVIVPRGGKGLIARISSAATIPVIKHLDGICHVYIDGMADIDKAINIAVNAKTHRYGVCNAMETLLIAESVATKVLPELAAQYKTAGVELRGCLKTCSIVPDCIRATEEDWATEYLAPVLSIKVVADIDEAMVHINEFSSGHTE